MNYPYIIFLAAVLCLACEESSTPVPQVGLDQGMSPPADSGRIMPDAVIDEGTSTSLVFEPDAPLHEAEHFFDFPFPSDLRLDAQGYPDLRGYPNPFGVPLVTNMLGIAAEHRGWLMQPVGWFMFDGDMGQRSGSDENVLLIDLEAGRIVPSTYSTLVPDPYIPEGVLAISPRPGVVLRPDAPHAMVVLRSLADASGQPLGTVPALQNLLNEPGDSGPLVSLYAPLSDALAALDVDVADVAAATVFTTGDVVRELFELSEAVRGDFDASIEDLRIDPTDGADHERFCELHGFLDVPQFQQGVAPFDTEGLFEFTADGAVIEQRRERIPIVINLPRTAMPEGGFPLVMYFHGSGGVFTQVVDRGRVTEIGGEPTIGEGPAFVLAEKGFATVGSAHPVNPDRVEGASDYDYLNFLNPAAFRDTFRQGAIEQRLYLDALLEIEIPMGLVEACSGLTIPASESAIGFSGAPVYGMGQSMGGMYTNIIGAIEPRIRAVVPTGAGGYWSWFLLETALIDAPPLVGSLLQTFVELTHYHPGLHILQLGWESSEPMVYMPRLSKNPLAGHEPRDVYQPVGLDDPYFLAPVFDAAAIAYGHQQAGAVVWPEMQEALSTVGLDGLQAYPVSGNLGDHTGVVVQYEADGILSAHNIFQQLDEVKIQYGQFFQTHLRTGRASVVDPSL